MKSATNRRSRRFPVSRLDHGAGTPGRISFSATKAKNEFGSVLEKVIQGNVVMITKHRAPKAVLMSTEEFNALTHATESRLDTLSGEFDELFARMQTPRARSARKAAFDASPRQLGRAARAAARKRG